MDQSIIIPKTGVGTLIAATSTSRVLLNLRAEHKTHSLCWSLFGGMIEQNEQPKDALLRELSEEIGFIPDIEKIYPFDVYQSRDKAFKYLSFVTIVKDEFIPELNDENCGYCWINLGVWPRPMHQGARITFCNLRAIDKIRTMLSQHPISV